jgi:hypothetical protein
VAINPMFRKDVPKMEKKHLTKRIETSLTESKTPRKIRSDKKYSVKIPLTTEQRQMVRKISARKGMYPTNLCSELVKKGLERGIPFSEIPYPSSSEKSFPAKIEKDYMDKLVEWTIKWDCSRKQAAHRILLGMLLSEGDGYD